MLLIAALIACGGDPLTSRVVDNGEPDREDTTAPVIQHDEVDEVITFGTDVPIQATVIDRESRVLLVTLWFKNETDGSSDWQQRAMLAGDPPEADSGEADPCEGATSCATYTSVIPASQQRSGGMTYYIEAVNTSDLVATAPDEGKADPFHFRLTQ
jgi:hypothetical protein